MHIETPDLEQKLQFLSSPASYGDPDTPVDCIETHMSWVFLVGDKAFKLKKPVRHEFLDFSSVDARGFYCREEVRLNRRLAPQVYLGMLALQWHGDTFALLPAEDLPAPGRTVDWLVLMRRLPAHDMLDQRIAHANVTTDEIDALVAVLAGFYRRATRTTLAGLLQHDRFQREQALNRAVLLHAPGPVPGAVHALERLDVALARHASLLAARASAGRLVEGHGDLRMEHVCLLRPPVVIDCLEFNAELRQVDPFEEIAFLGLECTHGRCRMDRTPAVQRLRRGTRGSSPAGVDGALHRAARRAARAAGDVAPARSRAAHARQVAGAGASATSSAPWRRWTVTHVDLWACVEPGGAGPGVRS